MIRFALRAAGVVLVAAAFAALVVDGTRSIAGGRLLQSPLGDVAAWLWGARDAVGVQALAGLRARPEVSALLGLPAWGVAGAVGLALLRAGRAGRG